MGRSVPVSIKACIMSCPVPVAVQKYPGLSLQLIWGMIKGVGCKSSAGKTHATFYLSVSWTSMRQKPEEKLVLANIMVSPSGTDARKCIGEAELA